MSEEQVSVLAEESVFKKFMSFPVFLVIGVSALAMYLGVLPEGMIGGMCILLPFALLVERIGNRIPILKDWLGGAPLLLIFLGASLTYYHVIPQASIDNFDHFMRGKAKQEAKVVLHPENYDDPNAADVTFSMHKKGRLSKEEKAESHTYIFANKPFGSNFLDFYICGLIAGAIFGINSKLLLKAGLRYAAPLLACILCCCLLVGVIGSFTSMGWKDAIFKVAFPILGGGMGGGALPMNQVIESTLNQDWISYFVPALALGNIFAIIAAGLLDKLGQVCPSLSGNGEILKDSTIVNEEPKVELTMANIIIGLAVSTSFFALGKVLKLALFNISGGHINIHHLALMILVVAILKILNLVPEYIIVACYSWFRFIIKAFTGIILFAIGVVYTDLGQVIEAVTPLYVILCACVVFASIIGAGFVGRLVGFNFVESAITAGLCMANMGGTGDVAVLSASRRMALMPFARFSTSLGGGFVIILCGILVPLFYDKI